MPIMKITLVVSAALVAMPAVAADVIDASYTPAQGVYGFSLGIAEPLAQTFTVQNAGVLDRVQVALKQIDNSPDQSVTLSIVRTINGLPSLSTGDVLASSTRSYSSFASYNSGYSLSNFVINPFTVTAGEQLSIVLTTDGYQYLGWNQDYGGFDTPAGTYEGGDGYYGAVSFSGDTPTTTGWNSIAQQMGSAGSDFNFRTFVTPSPESVPEPATWSMMILGMGAVGFAMRRNRTIKSQIFYHA